MLILIVAAVFRFQHIASIPPGLYPDEAINGNQAIQALETGQHKVFYPENNGREGLFMDLQAISLKVFGPSAGSGQAYPIWSLRVPESFIMLSVILFTY